MSPTLTSRHISKMDIPAVTLHAPERTDVDFMYLLDNGEEAWRTALQRTPVSRKMLWDYVENYTGDIYADRTLRMIVRHSDHTAPVGMVELYDYSPADGRAFVGIAIAPAYRRQGFGRAALQALCRYASDVLSLHQLAAVVAFDNDSSRALFSACGFRSRGRLHSWLKRGPHYTDCLIFQRLFC